MNSIKVCEYSRSRSFHDDLILQDQASGERSQDQWSSGFNFIFFFLFLFNFLMLLLCMTYSSMPVFLCFGMKIIYNAQLQLMHYTAE